MIYSVRIFHFRIPAGYASNRYSFKKKSRVSEHKFYLNRYPRWRLKLKMVSSSRVDNIVEPPNHTAPIKLLDGFWPYSKSQRKNLQSVDFCSSAEARSCRVDALASSARVRSRYLFLDSRRNINVRRYLN